MIPGSVEAIETRWNLVLPASYTALLRAGAFSSPIATRDPVGVASEDLLRDEYLHGPVRLLFTDLEWLQPDEIEQFEPSEFEIAGLIPFAESARRDLWCWYPAWQSGADVPIVYCSGDSDVADVYAPNFDGFLFRKLLDEFAGTWLDKDFSEAEIRALWARCLEALRPWLSAERHAILGEMLGRPWVRRDGTLALVSPEEADSIAERELQFERFGQEFKHHR